MRQLRAAVRFGADAVYVGMKNYGLRAYAGNFDDAQLKEAIAIVHGAGKRLYVTMNIFAYDEDIPGMLNAAQRAQALGVDAAIVSDLGVMTLLRKQVPALPLHVSTQANTVNARPPRCIMRWARSASTSRASCRFLRSARFAKTPPRSWSMKRSCTGLSA